MSKVVIIGIDGLDPFLIERWRDVLPNFKSMYNKLSEIIIESTFPPDSICAWASIFTGENPAEHGLIESIDYLSNNRKAKNNDNSSHIKGKTFWDKAGANGKSVCVINPFIAYPAWNVNGIMVSGPVFEGGETTAYPDSIIHEYKFPSLGGMVDFPDEKDLGQFQNNTKDLTARLAEVSLEIYKDRKHDLFFLTFLTLDRIKHFFWRFMDESDIYYPGDNPFKYVIKDFYMLFDEIIGNFLKFMDGDSVLIVISDHGHRRRCSLSLNLNEIMRQEGYLSTAVSGPSGVVKKMIEKTKVFTLRSLSDLGLQDWTYRIAKYVPNRKALKKSTYLINHERSRVTLANICGSNPYGGLNVSAAGEEYERLRNNVISELLKINNSLGKNVIEWAKKRELIYKGKYENRFPDILFQLNEDYGVGMDLFTKPITKNYSHKKISGGHKREAVLLRYPDNNRKNTQCPDSIIGLKDYILKILFAEQRIEDN